MEPSVHGFWLPKNGNSKEEYEDAFEYSLPELRFAMADGATESSFADRWARSLVRKFTTDSLLGQPLSRDPLLKWLTPLQREWHQGINWEKLPWYAEEKARQGAFSTLLGLQFVAEAHPAAGPSSSSPPPSLTQPKSPRWGSWFRALLGRAARVGEIPSASTVKNYRWQAFAVGDSCLFHVREDQLLKAFPLDRPDLFSSRPYLLSSNPDRNLLVWDKVKCADGDCRADDLFILATDALALWFLNQHAEGVKPWKLMVDFKAASDFSNFVAELRKKGAMRNDDTSLLVCRWAAPGRSTISPPATGAGTTRAAQS